MIKKHQIYKTDNWNMLTVEVNGTRFVVREISDQWGEDCQTFLSRQALRHWAGEHFAAEHFSGTEEERQQILTNIHEV
ncbi:hypothetical protein NV379_14575 [Paenibacillus sp. N1-5-1-14]|uniref:hypothetical protein n=1 Tax=Paenibacillus radicibacter TaxID=2972488 RepID=UPI0021596504|nr:hypothetical protein [Paenibacillus radicibacter]MCR8643878.1 hypothetical protein [Paenibacillus radicibacter]